jgi:VWFA-related protein
MLARPIVGAILLGLGIIHLSAQAQGLQTPSTIRSRTTLVPVDVRVVDERGNPVTDLTRDDFIVEEDGRVQEVRAFVRYALTPEAPLPGAAPLLTEATAATLSAQNQRLFLFVFGRGRLQSPEKGIDAAIDFVRQRLFPQDRVAVLAHNRATDFTTDRDRIVRTLERFKKAHEGIEADLQQQLGGLAVLYGSRTPSKAVQAQIDDVFREETTTARMLPSGKPADAAQMAEDTRRTSDIIQRGEILKDRDPSPFDALERAQADMQGMSFDEFAQLTAQTGHDLSSLYTGIRYLRHLDGEKHLVFVSESGLFLPRLENDTSLAALANDARVVVDTLQTGGIRYTQALPDPDTRIGQGAASMTRAAAVESASLFRAVQSRTSLRTISELTGGTTSLGQTAGAALEQIDRASRFDYLLGYAPADAGYDGRFRRIAVRVNRPGLRVLSRRGYYARPDALPFDRRQFMTYSRMAAAANITDPISDLALKATVDNVDEKRSLRVNITVGPKGVAMGSANGRHTGAVNIAIFCGDGKQTAVCEHWQSIDFNLSDGTYQLFLIRGGSYSQRIPLTGEPMFVKVIAYDYTADALGSAMVRVK